MRHTLRAAITTASILALAACGGSSAESSDLDRDLAAASGSGVELAPRTAGRTDVISSVEQTGSAPRRVAAVRAPQRAAVRVASRRVAPEDRAGGRASDPAAEPPVMSESTPDPGARPAPPVVPADPEPGRRYRSVSDVIRNSPIPITP